MVTHWLDTGAARSDRRFAGSHPRQSQPVPRRPVILKES